MAMILCSHSMFTLTGRRAEPLGDLGSENQRESIIDEDSVGSGTGVCCVLHWGGRARKGSTQAHAHRNWHVYSKPRCHINQDAHHILTVCMGWQAITAAVDASLTYAECSSLVPPLLDELLGDAEAEVQLETLRQMPQIGTRVARRWAAQQFGVLNPHEAPITKRVPSTLHWVLTAGAAVSPSPQKPQASCCRVRAAAARTPTSSARCCPCCCRSRSTTATRSRARPSWRSRTWWRSSRATWRWPRRRRPCSA